MLVKPPLIVCTKVRNPTVCGQHTCVKLQRLLDYRVTLNMLLYGDHTSKYDSIRENVGYHGVRLQRFNCTCLRDRPTPHGVRIVRL